MNRYRFVARVAIEFESPFLLGSGREGLGEDTSFVKDANGLPTIPGSSIAGVLRHHFKGKWADADLDNYFGDQAANDGHGSRLSFSWACLHNSRNNPVEGRLSETEIADDKVLEFARHSLRSDHVRIDHRGTADDKGKFEENFVASGSRFTFEIMLESKNKDSDEHKWDELLSALCNGNLCFGGKTRRGFGAFNVIEIKKRVFDLINGTDFKDFVDLPVNFAEALPGTWNEHTASARSKDSMKLFKLKLNPESFWFIGGGMDDKAHMSPVKTRRIKWVNGNGEIDEELFYIPATAIKGPLSHRTAFHYNAIKGDTIKDTDFNYADNYLPDAKYFKEKIKIAEDNAAVRALFGYCKKDKQQKGMAGRVFIEDILITKEKTPGQKIVNHVSIDAFTGGARRGHLFNEKPFFCGSEIDITIRVDADESIDSESKKAFARALTDLVEGRLAVGSGVNRGNGYFNGTVTWPDGEDWLQEVGE